MYHCSMRFKQNVFSDAIEFTIRNLQITEFLVGYTILLAIAKSIREKNCSY